KQSTQIHTHIQTNTKYNYIFQTQHTHTHTHTAHTLAHTHHTHSHRHTHTPTHAHTHTHTSPLSAQTKGSFWMRGVTDRGWNGSDLAHIGFCHSELKSWQTQTPSRQQGAF